MTQQIADGTKVRVTAGPHSGQTGVYFNVEPGDRGMIAFDNPHVYNSWLQNAHEPLPGKCSWYISRDSLEIIPTPIAVPAPSVAADLRLKPQAKTILRHLKQGRPITPMKAMVVYGNPRLAASIFEIRKIGYNVTTSRVTDEAGHGYAEYTLA